MSSSANIPNEKSCKVILQQYSENTYYYQKCKSAMDQCNNTSNNPKTTPTATPTVTPTPTEEAVNFWDSLFNKNATYDKCGLGSQIGLSDRLLALLVKIYKTITTLAVVIVIVLGMLDFLKATSSDDADAMKKAGQKFMKRFIAVILLVMLPYLLEFILGTFGNERMKTCVSQFR